MSRTRPLIGLLLALGLLISGCAGSNGSNAGPSPSAPATAAPQTTKPPTSPVPVYPAAADVVGVENDTPPGDPNLKLKCSTSSGYRPVPAPQLAGLEYDRVRIGFEVKSGYTDNRENFVQDKVFITFAGDTPLNAASFIVKMRGQDVDASGNPVGIDDRVVNLTPDLLYPVGMVLKTTDFTQNIGRGVITEVVFCINPPKDEAAASSSPDAKGGSNN